VNDTLKFAVLASTVSLVLFGVNVYHILFGDISPRMSDIANIQIAFVQTITSPSAPKLMESLPETLTPYTPFFFENMKLYGMRRSGDGVWTALFAGESGTVIALKPGATHDGVTVVSTDERSCRVRYGSVERNFVL